MSATLFALFLACMQMVASLAPITPARAELALAIATVVDADEPFFRADEAKVRTLAMHVAVAFRESSLTTDIAGDGGHSFCAFQIHDSSGGSASLRGNAGACAGAGHNMLRTSVRVCRAHPIAWYAEGPNGCDSERAKRISADRMNLAARLAKAAR